MSTALTADPGPELATKYFVDPCRLSEFSFKFSGRRKSQSQSPPCLVITYGGTPLKQAFCMASIAYRRNSWESSCRPRRMCFAIADKVYLLDLHARRPSELSYSAIYSTRREVQTQMILCELGQ
jgi:hypothetical protein